MIRLFAVGCSRSGTSILQRELHRQLNLYSLRETMFFLMANEDSRASERLYAVKKTLSAAGKINEQGGRYHKFGQTCLMLFRLLGPRKALRVILGRRPLAYPLIELLDAMAREANCQGWLEKTPLHFRSIETLLGCDNTKVLFVIRNGVDVVASIRDRYQKTPEPFPGQGDVKYAIDLWNESLRVAERYADDERVGLISYEDFCATPDQAVQSVGAWLGAARDDSGAQREFKIHNQRETWKEGLSSEVKASPSKAKQLFSDEEIEDIRGRLDDALCEKLMQSPRNLLPKSP